MPHAGPTNDNASQNGQESPKEGRGAAIKKGATSLKDKAKENPKTAIAAGAAVVAGAVAAAAIPMMRARKKADGSKPASSKGNGRKGKSPS
jgi:hypothetical protein